MTTYKQKTKDKSRMEIWERAIVNLTSDRKNTQILKSRYITRLWDYAFDEMSQDDVFKGIKPNEYYINSWSEFSRIHYSEKKSEELKVAYFCGPEPENDLDIMVSLGIRIENVWAIESNKNLYNSALLRATELYPTLKIFNGKISELIKISPNKFDIIYLDSPQKHLSY